MKTFKVIVTVVMCCVLGIGLYSVNKHFQVKEKSNIIITFFYCIMYLGDIYE